MDRKITLIDSAEATAADVAHPRQTRPLGKKVFKGKYTFYVSDSPEKFKKLGRMFLGHPVKNVKRVSLD